PAPQQASLHVGAGVAVELQRRRHTSPVAIAQPGCDRLKALSATEIGLLALLELVFGIGLTWLGAGEAPTAHAMIGGALVVAALVLQQLSPQAKPA
ncbi:MAG: hypothetical protein ACO34D_09200, partial [Burkholderiaceae bacterium]